MEQYSVSVALFDFVPVAATAIGLFALASGIAGARPRLALAAFAAAALVVLGGLSKATWKLNMALHAEDVAWLNHLLFILMAPGFAALAVLLSRTGRATAGGALSLAVWTLLPLGGALLAALAWPTTRAWFFWLLAATTVANAALVFTAIGIARRGRLGWPVTGALVYNFAATLALGALARLPPGESAAWIQESVNLSAQAALAFAGVALARHLRATPIGA